MVSPPAPMERVRAWTVRAAVALPFLLPFLNPVHDLPIPSFYSEWLSLACGCLALAAVAGAAPLRIPAVSLAPLLLLAVVLVQAAMGYSPYAELTAATGGYLVWCAALMGAGASLSSRFPLAGLLVPCAWAALAGALLNAAAAAIQYYEGFAATIVAPAFVVSPLRDPHRIYGNLAQANHFASYLVIGANAALYLHKAGRLPRGWTWAAVLALAGAALGSGSRSLIPFLLLSMAVWREFFAFHLRRPPRGATALAMLALVAALAAFAIRHPQVVHSLGLTLSRFSTWADLVPFRAYLYEHAVRMFLQQPLLGAGFNAFAYRMFGQALVMPQTASHWVDINGHDIFLHLLAVSGVLGLLAVVLPLGAWMAQFRKFPGSAEKRFAIGVLLVIGLHSLVEYPLWYAYFLAPAALMLGLFSRRSAAVPGGRAAAALVMLACVLGLYDLLRYAHDYREVATRIYAQGPDRDSGADRGALMVVYRAGRFSRYVELTHPEWVVSDSSPVGDKLALNSRVIRFAPILEVAYRQAILLAADGQSAAALDALRLARAAYPQGERIAAARIAALAESQRDLFGPLRDALQKPRG